MLEIKRDFKELLGFDSTERHNKYNALVCPTNNIVKGNGELVMGAGIAKMFKERWPFLPKDWGGRVGGIICSPVVDVYCNIVNIVALPTKHDWRDRSDLSMIQHGVSNLIYIADVMGWKKIAMPRLGCGLGGLDWKEEVKPLLDTLGLDNRFEVIYDRED